jgi:TrbL/VirB6 plasmid conjugal transfer protein
LVVAILLTGLWAIWHALVRRRYTETAGALGLSLLFVVIALAFVARPEIVGQASRLTNQMSSAFLALSTHGSLGGEQQAKQADADQLFSLLVYDPWSVLEFGGLEHCVTGSGDQTRSVPVRPLSRDPARDAVLSSRLAAGTQVQADGKLCINNRNKYAPHFLRYAPESVERDLEYTLLKNGGKLGAIDLRQRGDYQLGDADKPAADAMGKGGQYQRLLLAIVVFAGELGAFGLLGSASVLVIVAQVLVLLLLAFAPVALVVGVVPGRGHEFFVGWLSRLGSYLLRKALYSLVLAVLLTVNGALADASSNLGWLLAFGLQAVFFWTVLLNRRQLVGQLSHTITGHGRVEPDGLGRAAIVTYAAARLATRHLLRRRREETDSSRGHHRGASADGPHDPSPGSGSADPGSPDRGGPSPSGSAPTGGQDRPEPAALDDDRRGPGSFVTPNSTSTRYGAPPEPSGDPSAEAAASGPAPTGDEDRDTRRAADGAPGGEPVARAPRRDGQRSASESPLRRGLRDDARRLRRESRRVGEEAQQLAEEGRRLRSDAQRARATQSRPIPPHAEAPDPANPPPGLDENGPEPPR